MVRLTIFRVRPDEVPSAEASWFEPGQYTAFGLRDGDGRNDRALLRPYSMASPPEERRWLEIYVRRVGTAPGSDTFTWRLWDLPLGGRLHVRGSYAGQLTLRHTIRDDDTRWRLFVASGTGLRPGGLTPETAVIFVCGLRGTIAETCRRLLRRGFVPADHRLRRWLGVADRVPASLFFEQYDTAPIFPAEQLEVLRQVLPARSR